MSDRKTRTSAAGHDLAPILYALGLSENYAGFSCLVAAVDIAVHDPGALRAVTKSLYPRAALCCGLSGSALERNIRTALSIMWDYSPDALRRLTGCPFPYKPPPAELISALAFCLRRNGSGVVPTA